MLLYEKEISSDFQAIHEAVCEVEDILKLKETWIDNSRRFTLLFLLREVLNNAAEHGNQFHPNKKIHLIIQLDAKKIVMEVTDEGKGFVIPEQIFDTDDHDTLLRTRNRGYPLLSQLATSLTISDKKVKVLLDYSQED